MKIRKRTIADILYPRHCPVCHEVLMDARRLVCEACEAELSPISSPYCMKCGRPVNEDEEYCENCRSREHIYNRGRAVFVYSDVWKYSIEKYKYYGSREYGDFYAACMTACLEHELKDWKVDVILPVPLHKDKERMRGFNQSWYLAKQISLMTGLNADNLILEKSRKTKSQKKLNAAERTANLRNAFQIAAEIRNRRILVVDDMYTTGSTMDEIARTLKKAGAEAVFFVTFCIGIT